jgi:hypothetical protein
MTTGFGARGMEPARPERMFILAQWRGRARFFPRPTERRQNAKPERFSLTTDTHG